MQIVEDSNLSVGSFYHRFNGKEELLAAALEGVFADFEKVLPKFDHSIEKNQNLYTLFYRLSVVGRGFVARHRGIYRAASEIARSDFEKLGVLAKISVAIADHISNEMGSYADQLGPRYKPVQVRHAVQLLAMTTMQSELGMGPLFPEEIPEYANTISRAMCGILDYTGKPILIET